VSSYERLFVRSAVKVTGDATLLLPTDYRDQRLEVRGWSGGTNRRPKQRQR